MNKKRHSRLWLYFSGVVFITGFIVFTITALIWLLLFELEIIQIDPHTKKVPIVLFLFGSMLLGTTIALFVGKRIIRPIQNICNAFDELSRGNFDVKVPENERIEEIREMAQHFNSMITIYSAPENKADYDEQATVVIFEMCPTLRHNTTA